MWKVVAIDETNMLGQDMREKYARLWTLYFFKETLAVHVCEITPSYEMFPFNSVLVPKEEPLTDRGREQVFNDECEISAEDEDVQYMHCRDVDRLPADRFKSLDFTFDPDDSYDDEIEFVGEYLNGNAVEPDCVAASFSVN
jgi:hypothetical protein